VVTRLDRSARSTSELLRIAERITERKAEIQSLDEPWADTTSPSGQMIMAVFTGIAEFERTLILSRTQDDRLPAQARGVAFGRPKKCCPISRNSPENSPETENPSAASPGPLTSIQPRSIASSTDSPLMLHFCSAQPHRPGGCGVAGGRVVASCAPRRMDGRSRGWRCRSATSPPPRLTGRR